MRMLSVHCAVLNARTSILVRTCSQSYGGHGERETPGPIPNPEAKPLSADGTALETGWESRTPPDNHSRRGPSIHAGAPSSCPENGNRPHRCHNRHFGTYGPVRSAAGAGFLRRGADVVGQPGVQRRDVAPGGADLVQGTPCVQP